MENKKVLHVPKKPVDPKKVLAKLPPDERCSAMAWAFKKFYSGSKSAERSKAQSKAFAMSYGKGKGHE